MDKKNWIIQFSLTLFTISMSITLIPCGIVNVYGLFGEIYSSIITEQQEEIVEKTKQLQTIQKVKGINVFNSWFELFVFIIYICYFTYIMKLPREDTIVTLKVRMDN